MAKKKPGAQNEAVRLKAKEMREAQARGDKRTRNIIIVVVSIVVIAIVAALVYVVQSEKGQSGAQSGGEAVPAQFAGGEPIVVSDLGVGQKNPDLQDLTLYYSYTCHWCAYLENAVGPQLSADAQAGKYNLILQPVNTAEMAWQGPATSAALVAADQDPENFLAFHQSMFDYFFEQYQASNASVIDNTDASVQKIAELAAEVGISQEVIDQFGTSATSYLAISTPLWSSATVEGRSDRPGTPEIVFNGQLVGWGQGTSDEIYTQIITGMTAAGFTQ